ncbi:hypothetical protein BU15DRAFT_83561 [Melanogaster broomeanus]|nr:hypothetical protein BU15DRAFT_83561 [Melanogaster broomeanus]
MSMAVGAVEQADLLVSKTDRLRDLLDEDDCDVGVGLNALWLEDLDSVAAARPVSTMEEPLGARIHATLCQQNYWGDPPKHRLAKAGNLERFGAYAIAGDRHCIMDHVHPFLPDVLIPNGLLLRPKFDLCNWYRTRRGEQMNLPRCAMSLVKGLHEPLGVQHGGLGDPLSRRVEDLLSRHGYFPGDGPECLIADRFACRQITVHDYEIWDHALAFKVRVPSALLLRSCFNVIGWYSKRLEESYRELATGLMKAESEVEVNCFRCLEAEPLSEADLALE